MSKKRFLRITLFDVLLSIVMIILSLAFIYPVWSVFVAAFSEPLDYVKEPLVLFPKHPTLYNFRMLMSSKSIWLGYLNTLIYVSVGTLINVIMTFVMAYALSMEMLPYKRFFGFIITVTLFFSGGMIPGYLTVRNYGMLDTIWAIVIPGAISTYNLMITRTYLSQQIPAELIEAAETDGASAGYTFLRIVTPLSRPILAVIALFSASDHWNSFSNAMIYLNDRAKYPLQLVLREILLADQTMGLMATESYGTQAMYIITLNFAIIVVSILPLLLIFPFVQKSLVKGMMIGAIKG